MTTASPRNETWQSWSRRLADELRALSDGGWLTLSIQPARDAPPTDVPTRGWRRLRRRAGRMPPGRLPAPSEAFVQVRLLEGRLALECIADTQFEGVSDLTDAQQRRLVDLGWEQDGREPSFSRTFEPVEHYAEQAAGLLTATVRDVLGAPAPDAVELRRPC